MKNANNVSVNNNSNKELDEYRRQSREESVAYTACANSNNWLAMMACRSPRV